MLVTSTHMKNFKTILSVLLLFCSIVAFAASPADFSSEADAYLSKLTAQAEFSGAVLVATNGSVAFSKGYGLANRELDVANTPDSVFRLGSVTKQFTAMCILMLQEDHRLNVTNLISHYVENCPEAWRAITIHHLLTHTSGITSFTGFEDNLKAERLPTTVTATVLRFRDKPLEFEPGTQMHYSNSGYVLLGYIIEKVSGMTYDHFVSERIFQPLGMKHSGYDHPADIVPHRASGYSRQGTNIVNCIPFAMDTPHAAGALHSTIGDMLIWDQSLYSTRLISANALDLMFTPFKNNYCYGWRVSTNDNRIRYSHSGGISGFKTYVVRFPKERVYVVVLSNLDWAQPPGIANKLSSMFFNAK